MKRIKNTFRKKEPEFIVTDPSEARTKSSTVELFKQKFDEGIIKVDFSLFLKSLVSLELQFGKINPVAYLAWCISAHPYFKNIKFNIPVDIPANLFKERTVGFVFIRPDYFRSKYESSLAFKMYLEFFNSQFAQLRKRKGAGFKLVDSASIVHPLILRLFFKMFPTSLEEVIGGICLTLLKEIDYALPPLSDNIHGGIIFSYPMGANNNCSTAGIRSFKENSEDYISGIEELFSNLNHYVTFKQ